MQAIQIKESDLSQVIQLHKLAFEHFFLSSLGYGFLNVFYLSLIGSDRTMALGVYNERKELVAFAFVAEKAHGYYKKLFINNFIKFFIVGIRILFTNPGSILAIIKKLRKEFKLKKNMSVHSEILSIATHPEQQGKGCGRILLNVIEKKLKELHLNKIMLTTDVLNNEEVLRFYFKNGYHIYNEFIRYPNRKMYRLLKHLN